MDDETRDLANNAFLKELDDIRKWKIGGPHDQPGLRAAFPYWFVQKFLGIEEDTAIKDIIAVGHQGDFECDFFTILNDDGSISKEDDVFSEEQKTIIWGQCKLADQMDNEAFNTGNLEKLIAVEDHLKETEQELIRIQANQEFRYAAKLFKETTIRTSGATWRGRIKIVIAVAGKIQQQASLLLEHGSEWRLHKFEGLAEEKREIEIFEIDEILTRMMLPNTPPVLVEFVEEPIEKFDSYDMDPKTYRQPDHTNGHTENQGECNCNPKGNRSLIGHISANNLVGLHTGTKGVGDTIFLENPRSFLGIKRPTYTAMNKTLSSTTPPGGKSRFWKFNNGVTATCDEIINEDGGKYLIKNMKIVNGQQTTTTLTKSTENKDNVQVGLRIHVTTDDDERKQISKSTNRQNALSGEEMMDIGSEHSNLKLQCEQEYPKYYYERQKEGYKSEKDTLLHNRVTPRRNLVKANTAISFYAYNVDPQRAMILGAGKIFDETLPHDYQLVYFNDPSTIPELTRPDGVRVQAQKYGPVRQESPTGGILTSPGLAGNVTPEGYRHVRELIIAHIFQSLLDKINLKWTSLMQKYNKYVEDDSSDQSTIDAITADNYWLSSPTHRSIEFKHKRVSDMSGKGQIQYFILNWIHDSMERFGTKKYDVEEALIEKFGNIQLHNDPIPDELLKIVEVAWKTFLESYDWNKIEQWLGQDHTPPNPSEVMTHLRKTEGIVSTLRGYNEQIMEQRRSVVTDGTSTGDMLMVALESLLPPQSNNTV